MFWKIVKNAPEGQKAHKIYERIRTILSSESEENLRYLSAYAGLLGRVAYSDLQITAEEIDKIKKVLKKTSSLASSEIDAIADIINNEIENLSGLENHIYTRELNELATKERKDEIMLALFLIAAADGEISPEEESELRKISQALNLSNNDFIETRALFVKYLPVFK